MPFFLVKMPNAIVIPFAKLKTATVNKSSISAVSTQKIKKKWEIIIEDMVQSIHLFNATTEKSPNH